MTNTSQKPEPRYYSRYAKLNDGDTEIAICTPDGYPLTKFRFWDDPRNGDALHFHLDADFLVKRLNGFDTLLGACKRTLRNLELMLEMDDPQACTQMDWEAEPLDTLRRAIAEAEEG